MVALNGSQPRRIAQAIIELNQADLDPHRLAQEKTVAVKAMLLDSVRPLPLIEVVKEWHGRRPMSVGTGSKALLPKRCWRILACATTSPRWWLPITWRSINATARYLPAVRGAHGRRTGKPWSSRDADFGLEAAKRAGMDAVDVRLLGGDAPVAPVAFLPAVFLSATLLPGNSEVVLVCYASYGASQPWMLVLISNNRQ